MDLRRIAVGLRFRMVEHTLHESPRTPRFLLRMDTAMSLMHEILSLPNFKLSILPRSTRGLPSDYAYVASVRNRSIQTSSSDFGTRKTITLTPWSEMWSLRDQLHAADSLSTSIGGSS